MDKHVFLKGQPEDWMKTTEIGDVGLAIKEENDMTFVQFPKEEGWIPTKNLEEVDPVALERAKRNCKHIRDGKDMWDRAIKFGCKE